MIPEASKNLPFVIHRMRPEEALKYALSFNDTKQKAIKKEYTITSDIERHKLICLVINKELSLKEVKYYWLISRPQGCTVINIQQQRQ
jgi:hypothetical protein